MNLQVAAHVAVGVATKAPSLIKAAPAQATASRSSPLLEPPRAFQPSATGTNGVQTAVMWGYQTDVVVVGSGGAGMSAALGAVESGAEVIILEKAASAGGTTIHSGGGLSVPNTIVMSAAGLTWPQSDVLEYLNNIGGAQQDADLINVYLQQGPVCISHLMNDYGLTFTNSKIYDIYYNVPGAWLQALGPQVSASGAGAGLIKVLTTAVNATGLATTMLNAAATALYKDPTTGMIVGVQASASGSAIIAAAQGVVLAAGGFDFNPEMMAHYPRGPILGSVAVETNSGDGIQLAMAAGADIRNMNNVWGLPVYVTPTNGVIADWAMYRSKPGAIVVNSAGNRFMNESSTYPVANRAFLAWDSGTFSYPNIPAYTIMDSTAFNNYGLAGATKATSPLLSYISTASTLAALAAALNINPTGLQNTVTTFNTYAANGVDPDFNRGAFIFDTTTAGDPTRTDLKNDCLGPIETPPFYGPAISPGTCGSCGGPRINSNGQILDQTGSPIPGLYGAGNDVAGLWGAAYPGGGGTLGPATVFGWLAGKSAGSSTSSDVVIPVI